MKIKCPKSDEHKRFVTTVYVSEDWIVDTEGAFEDLFDDGAPSEVLHRPNLDNLYGCAECGAECTAVAD